MPEYVNVLVDVPSERDDTTLDKTVSLFLKMPSQIHQDAAHHNQAQPVLVSQSERIDIHDFKLSLCI